MATLTVKLFGAPSVEMDGQGVVLPYRRAEALLYYLVLKKKASRSELVGLLWSDTDPSTALKNLRHAIYTVRKRLGFDLFLPGQRTILEIDPQLEIRCDVLDFLERGDPSLCTGTFLESFSLHSTSLFDIWAEEQRELLQSLYLKKLLESARSALASGDPVHAEKYALAYTALDPLDESAAVTLMDIYQAQKKYHKAIGTYQDLCRNLSAELSISPLKETTAAYYALINQWNDSAGEETSPEEDLVLGKDSALRSLHALLLGRDSRCSCMLVEGEAGVGKTYLLDHLLPDYSSPERLVCRCRCYESEMSVPLSPWSAVMMSVAAELDPRGIHVPDNYMKTAAALSLAVFLFLTVGYMVLAPWIDLSAIPEKLRDSGVTAENFPLVAAYITLGNSFLEEFFFRGFAFLTLRKHTGEKFAYLFSGVTFAAYHVSIMSGWFHPVWFVVFLAGLAVGGMLFDALDRKGGLWCGWLVHASADLAIMLIGMRMFGIL